MSTTAHDKNARARFVLPTESWPAPVVGDLPLAVLDEDGQRARMFVPTSAEVTLIGESTEAAAPTLVVPIGFATLDQATRAADVLAEAFAQVRAIQDEPIPSQSHCSHQLTVQRFSRTLPKTIVCALCGAIWDQRPSTKPEVPSAD